MASSPRCSGTEQRLTTSSTQMVWKSTTKVGCARKLCSKSPSNPTQPKPTHKPTPTSTYTTRTQNRPLTRTSGPRLRQRPSLVSRVPVRAERQRRQPRLLPSERREADIRQPQGRHRCLIPPIFHSGEGVCSDEGDLEHCVVVETLGNDVRESGERSWADDDDDERYG